MKKVSPKIETNGEPEISAVGVPPVVGNTQIVFPAPGSLTKTFPAPTVIPTGWTKGAPTRRGVNDEAPVLGMVTTWG